MKLHEAVKGLPGWLLVFAALLVCVGIFYTVYVASCRVYFFNMAFGPDVECKAKNKILAQSSAVISYSEIGGVRGNEKDKVYVHIKTPLRDQSGEMWRFDVKGYAYFDSSPLDITWVGYLYNNEIGKNKIINGQSLNKSGDVLSDVVPDSYIGKGGNLWLKFGPISKYHLSFSLDYQSGSISKKIEHESSDYSVQLALTEDLNY